MQLNTLARKAVRLPRYVTSPLRSMPNFIIFGSMRCGTTSLYDYLTQHPWVRGAAWKELHFFDRNYQKGRFWYKAQFPSIASKVYNGVLHGRGMITGESSPNYILYPQVAERISETTPDIKLIALLRNPVDRAYSHYNYSIKHRREQLTFEEAIQEEETLHSRGMAACENRGFKGPHGPRPMYHYLSPGLYANQLEYWIKLFPSSNILVLKTEDFFETPGVMYEEILEFLKIPSWKPDEFLRLNDGGYTSEMDPDMRNRLSEFYEPHNRKLYDLLGKDFSWE